jgi:eukaryotic-like serine/threonine-protein kinase
MPAQQSGRNSPDDPSAEGADATEHVENLFATRTVASSELSDGTVIGAYHLLQLIGTGGMGEVWMAEQREPVRRRVAVKLIKAGMDTREVVVRFESERQALALMDHPAIAKDFDAGSTPEVGPTSRWNTSSAFPSRTTATSTN